MKLIILISIKMSNKLKRGCRYFYIATLYAKSLKKI